MIALVSFGMQVAFHSGHCRLLQVFVILLEIYNLARREDTVTQYITVHSLCPSELSETPTSLSLYPTVFLLVPWTSAYLSNTEPIHKDW